MRCRTIGCTGGFTSVVVPHPIKPGLMHLRTDIGSAYRWDSQRKEWVPGTYWMVSKNSICNQ